MGRSPGIPVGTYELGDLLAGRGPERGEYLYVVRGGDEKLIYIGMTTQRPGERLRAHITGRSPLGRAIRDARPGSMEWTATVMLCPSGVLLADLEMHYIRQFEPPLNTAGLPVRTATPARFGSQAWRRLSDRDPRLKRLRWRVERLSERPLPRDFCFLTAWYGHNGIRERLSELVGWDVAGKDKVLGSEKSYDLVYDTLYGLLPECLHEGTCPG